MEKANSFSNAGASMIRNTKIVESGMAWGKFNTKLFSPAESKREEFINLRSRLDELMKNSFDMSTQQEIFKISQKMESMLILMDEQEFPNAVTTEGKNAGLQHIFKSSAYTVDNWMGLIGNVSYTAPDATDVASAINTAASANGWNEAVSGVSSIRKLPVVGTPSAGSVACSSLAFPITGTDTINGVFFMIRSLAGVVPTSTVGNTAGAIWSAGALSVARAVINGDTLNVTYTTGL